MALLSKEQSESTSNAASSAGCSHTHSSDLALPQTVCRWCSCSSGIMNSHEPKLRQKETITKSKAETGLGVHRPPGQAGSDPRGCHPMELEGNFSPPTCWPQVKTSFSREALKGHLNINLSVLRGFSAAVHPSRSQTGPHGGVPRLAELGETCEEETSTDVRRRGSRTAGHFQSPEMVNRLWPWSPKITQQK